MRRQKHQHEWEWYSAKEVDTYGDGWGNMTKLPTRVETHLSGRCITCGEPRLKVINGVWTLPAKGQA